MIGRIATAIVLAGLMLGPAHAQGLPTPPDGPPPGAPDTKVEDTKAERQKNNAAKLAGLVAFVRTNCPDLRPDDARFRSVVASLGVPFDDLQAGDLHLRALTYAEVYAKDIPASCARATENFGPGGRTIPDLIAKR